MVKSKEDVIQWTVGTASAMFSRINQEQGFQQHSQHDG